jgi:hypothetical protein
MSKGDLAAARRVQRERVAKHRRETEHAYDRARHRALKLLRERHEAEFRKLLAAELKKIEDARASDGDG